MPRPSKPHQTKRGHWRVRIRGKQHHLGTDKQAAHNKFHKLMANEGVESESRPVIIAELIDAYLDLYPGRDRETRLAVFIQFAARFQLCVLDEDILTRYHTHLQRRKYVRCSANDKDGNPTTGEPQSYARASINDRMREAARALKWARKRRWIDFDPQLPRLPRPVRKCRDLDPATLNAVLTNLPERSGRILRFMLYTGCRPSEACRLIWDSVDLRRRVCIVYEHKTAGKTGDPRTLYLTPNAAEILRAIPKKDGFVFTSRLGTPYTVAGLRSILRRRGDATPYQFRHTFAQGASEQIPEPDLGKLMGHRDSNTTRRYYTVRDTRAKQAAANLVFDIPVEAASPSRPPKPTAPRPPRKRRKKPAGPGKGALPKS